MLLKSFQGTLALNIHQERKEACEREMSGLEGNDVGPRLSQVASLGKVVTRKDTPHVISLLWGGSPEC
jgi:hypothetical protein